MLAPSKLVWFLFVCLRTLPQLHTFHNNVSHDYEHIEEDVEVVVTYFKRYPIIFSKGLRKSTTK